MMDLMVIFSLCLGVDMINLWILVSDEDTHYLDMSYYQCHLCIVHYNLMYVLFLQSHDWIRVRIQQMEPDLMEVGSSLEESMQLRREHDELLYKLNVSTIYKYYTIYYEYYIMHIPVSQY